MVQAVSGGGRARSAMTSGAAAAAMPQPCSSRGARHPAAQLPLPRRGDGDDAPPVLSRVLSRRCPAAAASSGRDPGRDPGRCQHSPHTPITSQHSLGKHALHPIRPPKRDLTCADHNSYADQRSAEMCVPRGVPAWSRWSGPRPVRRWRVGVASVCSTRLTRDFFTLIISRYTREI